MNGQTAWIMIGILGSGKSTWARKKVESDPSISIVSRDDVRQMLNGSYKFIEDLEPLVAGITSASIEEVLSFGRNLIVDECHITRRSREEVIRWIRLFNKEVKVVGVWCPGKIDNVKRRMLSPKDQSECIWQRVYRGMIARFQDPTAGEFDELIVVNEELK